MLIRNWLAQIKDVFYDQAILFNYTEVTSILTLMFGIHVIILQHKQT